MAVIVVKSKDHWHEIRKSHVGASEVSSLFDANPFMSRWQLWQIKAGHIDAPDLSANERVMEGRHFEPAIASMAAEKFGLCLAKVEHYISCDDCPGMGASLDYSDVDKEPHPVEIKWAVNSHGWAYDGDEITDAPLGYLLQLQHQIGCVDATHGTLIAHVHGRLRIGVFERNDVIIDKIKSNIRDFWESIVAGNPPQADLSMDGDAISSLLSATNLRSADLSDDAMMSSLLKQYTNIKRDFDAAETAYDCVKAAIKKHIIDTMEKAGVNANEEKVKITSNSYSISMPLIERKGTVITPEMVGTIIGASKPFRQLRITNKEKDNG
jgi:putative phage-type endonuclease